MCPSARRRGRNPGRKFPRARCKQTQPNSVGANGYPYYGASADLYYNGYGNGRVYDGRYANSGGGSVVANVQQELARAGYYQGAIDGVIGNQTRSAIRAYERRNGLRMDGRIDSELLESMGVS